MTLGPDDPLRGRRGNGLTAAEWGALADVDPRLSEQLLDGLAAAGVPAWVEPAGATTDPVSRAGAHPSRPLHRLWVEVARADAARAVVQTHVADLAREQGLPSEQFVHPVPRGASGRVITPPLTLDAPSAPAAEDPDAAWRAIVEGFERSADSPVPPWPVEEDVDPTPVRREPPAASPARAPLPPVEPGLPGWVEPAPVADDGHYVPPAPPPPPRVKARTVAASAAILLGILLIFTPSLLRTAPGSGSFLLGLLLAGGGAGALVYWMRDTPGLDDGPDDGAVV
jgi:hypothetical protein